VNAYYKERRKIDPIFAEKLRTRSHNWYMKKRNKKPPRISAAKRELINHHETMKDDPERLSTTFIANLVGISCKRVKNL